MDRLYETIKLFLGGYYMPSNLGKPTTIAEVDFSAKIFAHILEFFKHPRAFIYVYRHIVSFSLKAKRPHKYRQCDEFVQPKLFAFPGERIEQDATAIYIDDFRLSRS